MNQGGATYHPYYPDSIVYIPIPTCGFELLKIFVCIVKHQKSYIRGIGEAIFQDAMGAQS